MQFFSQMADMDSDCIVSLAVVLIFPDSVEQLLCADHIAGIFQKDLQNRKFGRCQDNRFLMQTTFMRFDIQQNSRM